MTKSKGKPDENRKESREEQLLNRRRNRNNGEVADWGSCDPDTLVRAVESVTKHGYAISLGYTRGNGAYFCKVIGDFDFPTEYIRPSEDIDLYLRSLAEDFNSLD